MRHLELLTASLDIHLHPLYYMGMVSVKNTGTAPRKTKPKGRHPDKALSAAFVRTAPQGRHCDGNGLYLFVQPSGTRSWIQRLTIRGRQRELGLGSVALVSLAEAREGGDPLAEKRQTQACRALPKPPRAWCSRSRPVGEVRGKATTGCRA